jgi:hypothetical protein
MAHKWDVYIAGSMTNRPVREVLMERAEAKALLACFDLTYYDPAADELLELMDPEAIISNAFDKYRMARFVSKDLNAVSQCRAILNITGDLPSEGSDWEMAFAVYHRQIPVHLVAPLRVSGEKMSFTNILVDGLHNSLAEAIIAVDKALKETI